jgi:hypothetical protein
VADVYVLASPAPTLYVYPSQVHPTATQAVGGGLLGPVFQQNRPRRTLRDKGTLRYRVHATGRATARDHGRFEHQVALALTPRPLASAGALNVTSATTVTPLPLRSSARSQVQASSLIRCHDHRHLAVSPLVFDLLFD